LPEDARHDGEPQVNRLYDFWNESFLNAKDRAEKNMTVILNKVAAKVFGTANERLLKRLWPIVSEINALEAEMKGLSDEQLRERTIKFREHVDKRIAEAELTGGTPDEQKKALREVIDDALDEILGSGRVAPAGAGCIDLAWRYRDVLLA